MNEATAIAPPKGAFDVARPTIAVLPSFDLSRIIARVASEHSDWSQDRLREAEDGYRVFLATAKADRSGKQVPKPDVDEMWHAHILFTKQYLADCTAYFGYYFHHEPFDKPTERAGNCQGGDCGADSCTACGPGTIVPNGESTHVTH